MESNRLCDIREENDLTQDKLAKIMKVSRVAISEWENNTQPISLRRLNKYANYFGVSMDYLLGLSNVLNYDIKYKDIDLKLAGERLKEFRKKQNLTLRELAEFLNTTHSTLSSYEHGKTLILTNFAYQICKKYRISMDWLVGRI